MNNVKKVISIIQRRCKGGIYSLRFSLYYFPHIEFFLCARTWTPPPPHPAFRKAHLSLCYVTAIDKYELMEEPISIFRGIY